MRDLVVLGLGSNRGDARRDSRRIILDAIDALGEVLSELRRASLYETEPMYVTDQERFINTAVAGFYSGSARELLDKIHEIEGRFGRDRSRERRFGERCLDIDILLFADLRVKEPDMEIPHPRLTERRFALEPLLELLPEAAEPATGKSYRSFCDALAEQGVKRLSEGA